MRIYPLKALFKNMLRMRNRSLTSRLSAALIIVVMSSLILVGSGLIYIAADANEKNTAILQEGYAEKVAAMISDYITSAVDDLHLIDNLGILKAENYTQQLKIFENLIIYKGSVFSRIIVADAAGNEKIKISRYHTYMSREYTSLASTPEFTIALAGGMYISPVYISEESGLLSVQIAVRTSSIDRTNIVLAEINITKLWQDISEVKIGNTGYAYLVDKSGRYVASQHPADVFNKHGMNVIDKPPVHAFCSSREYNGVSSYKGIEDKQVIGAYAAIPGTEWAVIAELPSSEAYKNFRYMMIYLSALLAAGTLAAGIAGFTVSRRLVSHMYALTESARAMGNGDLEVEIPGQTDTDEIGILARTLNLMRSQLQGLYSDMQKHVAELTETRDALLQSEEKYRIVFENSGSAHAIIEDNNIVSLINRQFEVMTGFTKSEVEGKIPWPEFIADPGDLSRMQEYREKRIAGTEDVPEAYEFHLRGKNGLIQDVILSVFMLPETRQTFTAIMDISKLRETQLALTQSEQNFMAIFNNSYQLTALTDLEGVILEANRTALDLSGLSLEEIMGRKLSDILPWSYSQEVKTKLEHAIHTAAAGVSVRYETTNLAGDGTIHDLDFSIKPVTDKNGRVVTLIAEGRDITDKKQSEENRIKLEEQLRQSQKMESIGRLAGGIAHDFNNVLGGIMGTVSLVKHRFEKGTIENDYLKNMIMVIENSAKRAAGIVNQMLSLSRKQQTDFSTVDLNRCVHNVAELCRNSFDKGISIIEKYDIEASEIDADATQIEQVLLNICINASHAMTIMRPDGAHTGGILTLHVDSPGEHEEIIIPGHISSSGRYFRITISDTGVGIDPGSLPFIFDPFYSTKEKEKGTGLGLTMAYSIIHEHNGFINVTSEKDKGTEFTIFLPAASGSSENESRAENSDIFYGTGNILIVDDEDVMRSVAASILSECGYTPVVADNGFTAIEIIKNSETLISLVLLDMAMPGINGKETFMELKKLKPGLKVVLTSGFKHDLRVIESLKSGVDGFIQKPYTIYNLSRTVHDILNGNTPDSSTGQTI